MSQDDKSLKRKHDGDVNGQARKSKKQKQKTRQKKALAENEVNGVVGKISVLVDGEVTSQRRQKKRRNKSKREQWAFSRVQAGRFADREPVFLGDVLVAAIANEIRVLDVNDSSTLAVLPARSDKPIISFDALKTDEESLIRVLYADGMLLDWDWSANTTEDSTPSVEDVENYRLTTIKDRIASVYTTWDEEESTIRVDGIEVYRTARHILNMRALHGATLIVAHSDDALMIGRKVQSDRFRWIDLPWDKQITCMDARPVTASTGKHGKIKTDSVDIVLGQDDGVLMLYENAGNVIEEKALPTPRRLHWHRKSVNAVRFAEDGNYMLSGGVETVLIVWQLATGGKSYLPHLGSAVEHIAINPSGTRYALTLSDNSILVLSSSERKQVSRFASLQTTLLHHVTAAMHPTDKNKLLLAVPSDQFVTARPFLQTYDVQADKHLATQALSRNNITDLVDSPEGALILPPDVEHLAISNDGKWLATVDTWSPPEHDIAHLSINDAADDQHSAKREVYLKFWGWHAERKEWQLNSRIDQPHAFDNTSGKVFKLVAEHKGAGFVTIGEDSNVKIWRQRKVRSATTSEQTGVEWICKHIIDLEKAQDRTDLDIDGPPETACLATSDDGSLLTAALVHAGSQIIYLIDAVTGEVKSSHDNIAAPQLRELAFVDQHIVASSQGIITVWDVVQDRQLYSFSNGGNAENSMLAINKLDNVIAIALSATETQPPTVLILRTQPFSLVATIRTDVAVAALLPHPRDRGFLAVFEDATIRTLTCLSEATSHSQLDGEEAVVDEPMQTIEPVQLPQDVGLKTGSRLPAEDDRVVVRPEQLAKIFDVGNDLGALPSVRDMFHAVADLFARKPIVV